MFAMSHLATQSKGLFFIFCRSPLKILSSMLKKHLCNCISFATLSNALITLQLSFCLSTIEQTVCESLIFFPSSDEPAGTSDAILFLGILNILKNRSKLFCLKHSAIEKTLCEKHFALHYILCLMISMCKQLLSYHRESPFKNHSENDLGRSVFPKRATLKKPQ